MAQIGSFALLLALALSVYSFLAGLIALVFQNQDLARRQRRSPRGAAEDDPLLLRSSAKVRNASVRLLAAPASPPSPRFCWLRSSLSSAPFTMTSPSPISFTTAIATCPVLISSPSCGRDRKVPCCSGRCCLPLMGSSCVCAIRPTRACSPTLQWFSPAYRSSFFCC